MSVFWDLLLFYHLCHFGKLMGHKNRYQVPSQSFCLPIPVVTYLCIAHAWHGLQVLFVSVISIRFYTKVK